jgi:hypothetical protein
VGGRPRRGAGLGRSPRRGLPSAAGPLDGARHRPGYTVILTNLPAHELPAAELEPFYEARQTIEGWLSEAADALQLKGLRSPAFAGLEAFLLHAALASNLLNRWERHDVLPGSGLPHLGLLQLIGRVISLPARVLRTAEGHLNASDE